MQHLSSIKTWLASTKGLAIVSSSLLLLSAIRLYCRGGINRADRDLTGQVIVITGANTGIGK
jgi:hypothetical protein